MEDPCLDSHDFADGLHWDGGMKRSTLVFTLAAMFRLGLHSRLMYVLFRLHYSNEGSASNIGRQLCTDMHKVIVEQVKFYKQDNALSNRSYNLHSDPWL